MNSTSISDDDSTCSDWHNQFCFLNLGLRTTLELVCRRKLS